ncbi:UDP-glucosyltransferase 2-like isoform X3 [Ochlerotatus camptorhynchus]|uniref:UDP-glucosyltransferase 2-like isoform X3 n=1 Tax=Ochlerotatus camptorhynchus TaxID=644619 RepID=UPI0031E3BA1A
MSTFNRTNLKLLVILPSVIASLQCARILAICPSPAKSHHVVFNALVEALLDRGHHLTLMTTDPIQTNSSKLTQINWSYAYKLVEDYSDVVKATQEKWNVLRVIRQLFLVSEMVTEAEFNHPQVQAMIQHPHEQFDLVIAEYYHMTPFYAFAELYNTPLVGITSIESIAAVHAAIGNVANAVAHPEMSHKFSQNISFRQRIEAVITRIFVDYYLLPNEFSKYDRMIESHFGRNMSKSETLMKRVDLLMTNVEPVLGFVRPIVSQSVQLGFLHVRAPKPLPDELQSYLDSSSHGVIYFSLGTLIRTSSFNRENTRIFLDAFILLKYDVLWKSDGELVLDGAPNVRFVKWVPQQDLLAHPNVKLFVTQGGQQSMEEAVDRQVPMVVIPFNFDQFGNGDKVVERGIGKTIWMEHLTTENLREAILEVIGNKKYKRNIERLAKLVRDQPMRPLDKAVWWTEYVIRHQGASHLRYKQAQMPAWQYHYYDVVATLLATALVVLALVAYVLKRLLSYLLLRAQSWQVRRVKQKAL